MAFRVEFTRQHKTAEVSAGASLLSVAADLGIVLDSSCGGQGTCGKCRVRIVSGSVEPATDLEKNFFTSEEISQGWVLACLKQVQQDLLVETEPAKDDFSRKSELSRDDASAVLAAGVEKRHLHLAPPSIDDQAADSVRLRRALPGVESIASGFMPFLPTVLRRGNWDVTAVLAGETVVAVEAGDTTDRCFGLYFDIGTTTVLAALVDLNSGRTLAAQAAGNPQGVYGADVISRITYTVTQADGLSLLRGKLLQTLNELVGQLLGRTGVTAGEIYETTVVGNTTMSHLFLGVNPENLSVSPFIPAYSEMINIRAGDSGLDICPEGRVLVLPNVAGYVGSDTVGVMLATDISGFDGYSLAVDIGTNGEVVLAGSGRILTCSTAAGPAFEGAHIQNGMRAAEGAIETVTAGQNGMIHIGVIGHVKPRGICGSGLIDAVAVLLDLGIIDFKGKITAPDKLSEAVPEPLRQRVQAGNKGNSFILVPAGETADGADIVISQKDIRELQLAKGAICAGIKILCQDLGISPEQISRVLLAGAFGNYIKKESALRIGLFPGTTLEKISPVGNAAGDGARLALISTDLRQKAAALAQTAEHVELSGREDFQREFVQAVNFPTSS